MAEHRYRVAEQSEKRGSLSLPLSLSPVFRWHRSRLCSPSVPPLSKLKVDAPRPSLSLSLEEYRAVVPYQSQRRCNSCSIPRSRNKMLKVRERRNRVDWCGRSLVVERGWGRGEGWDRVRRVPSRGLVAEKTSMLHLRGEYSWVTVHPWNAGGERGSWRAEGGALDGIEEETEARRGLGCDTGSLLAAISSYAPAPIYSPALRISHHRLSRQRLSRPSTLLLLLPRSCHPLRTLYRSDDNVFGVLRQRPLVLHRRPVCFGRYERKSCNRLWWKGGV